MIKHYPLLFTPIYKEMLWGGNRLGTKYNRRLPYDKTGESWDVSCRPNEMGVIENGSAAGLTFEEYITRDRVGVMGTRLASQRRFPLLVKLIDANDTLSVQVHPDDAQAGPGTDTGKNEMWYVLTPPTDGDLVIGLKPGVTPETLARAYEDGSVEDCLNRLPVKAGDIVNIPAGLIHALTSGVMVAEVQQNSDITYRLYDYNRLGLDGRPRQLHVSDALAVTDFDGRIPKATVPGLCIKNGENNLVYSIANPHFAVIKYELTQMQEETSDPAAFCIYTCVEGEAVIAVDESRGQEPVKLSVGRSVFIPAGMGQYTLGPKAGQDCVLLKSFVPDIDKDFIAPLRQYGYSDVDIAGSTACDMG